MLFRSRKAIKCIQQFYTLEQIIAIVGYERVDSIQKFMKADLDNVIEWVATQYGTPRTRAEKRQEMADWLVAKKADAAVLSALDSIAWTFNVRGKDVFVMQSICSPPNDTLMEVLVMVDALKRASAARITAAIPYMGYEIGRAHV